MLSLIPQVNRSLRAPLASQLIFMPGGTATAAVATVTQQQPQHQQQQQQQQENKSTFPSTPSENDQVRKFRKKKQVRKKGILMNWDFKCPTQYVCT